MKGENKSMLVCTQCLRSGAVTKRIEAVPFRLPTDAPKDKDKVKEKAKAAPKAKAASKAKAGK